MSLPGLFPIYPDPPLMKYHVSLALPSIISEISASIGVTGSTSFLMPNIDYLQSFIKGDLGIADDILKDAMFSNFNSKAAQTDDKVFKSFAKSSNIPIDDVNKYRDSSGKLNLPKDAINLPKMEGLGFNAFERTMFTSLFETQKPYFEVAKLILANLAKIEDIIARVMPLVGIPTKTISMKPSVNGGSGTRPKAVGFQGASELKKGLSEMEKFSKYGSKNPTASTSNNTTNGGNGPNQNWEIVSAVYSTGVYIPGIDYQYTYIDLPPDEKLPDANVDLNLEDDDIYDKYKPEKIILGVFKSDGTPLDPNELLKTVSGVDPFGNVTFTDTEFKRLEWLTKSAKWKLHTLYPNTTLDPASPVKSVWPSIGGAIYKWKNNIGITQDSETKPGDGYDIKKYKKNDKNLLDRTIPAIEGNPMIVGFNQSSVSNYRSFLNDIIRIKMNQSDLSSEDKNNYSNEILNKVNIQSQIENEFIYGQNKTNVYKSIGNKPAFPVLMRTAFAPFQIYSDEAANDPIISAYNQSQGKKPGFIWVDPEADYDTKIIRIDPTLQIEFVEAQGEPKVQSSIKSFVKNKAIFKISNNNLFSIEISKNDQPVSIYKDITSYTLENWNYYKEDVLSNNKPVIQNDNSYNIKIYTKNESLYYSKLVSQIFRLGNIWIEIKKAGTYWTYQEFEFKTQGNYNDAVTYMLSDVALLNKLYTNYLANSSATWTYDIDPNDSIDPIVVNLKTVFESMRVYRSTENGFKILSDGTKIYVENDIIKKWMYLDATYDATNLPKFSEEITYVINYTGEINKTTNNYPITTTNKKIPLYKIKVENTNFPYGKIIDPSGVANDFLASNDLFSTGRYGIGNEDDPQEIEVIKRYMLTDLDTESYYIIEGVLSNKNKQAVSSTTTSSTSSGINSNDYYKLKDALGAIKPFVLLLVDVYSKLVPQINSLIELFKNPASFVTEIIKEKMGDGFSIFSKESFDAFTKAKSEFGNMSDKLPSEKSKAIKDIFKNSPISNCVHVDKVGNYKFVLDGVAAVPFEIFDKSLPFGMDINFANIPSSSPINLLSKEGMLNAVNLQDFLNPTKAKFNKKDTVDNAEVDVAADMDDVPKQPIIKMLLGIATIPIKIIVGIVEWLLDFFMSLVNPFTLPEKIKELLSFTWLLKFFTPKGILEVAGIKYNPEKLVEWIAMVNIKKDNETKIDTSKIPIDKINQRKPLKYKDAAPTGKYLIPDDYEIANMDEIVKMPFMTKLPTYTARQLREHPNICPHIIFNIFGLFEKIINGIISFLWSILGIEALIAAPLLKLIGDKKDNPTIEDAVNLAKNIPGVISSSEPTNSRADKNISYVYDIELSDGTKISGLDYNELQDYIKKHENIIFKQSY